MKKMGIAIFLLLVLFPMTVHAITVTDNQYRDDREFRVSLEDNVYSKTEDIVLHVIVDNMSSLFDYRNVTLYLPDGEQYDVGYIDVESGRRGDVGLRLSDSILNAGGFEVRCSFQRCNKSTGEVVENGTFRVWLDIEKASNSLDEWSIETGREVKSFFGTLVAAIFVVILIVGLVSGRDPDGILIIFRRK